MTPPQETAAEAPPVLAERRGAVLLLTLNRPERLNAVSLPMYRALLRALDELERDDALRAAVVTGAGRAFCVGADLKAHASGEPTDAERREYIRAAQRANARVQTCGKPVVAAVNGHAIGGGLELALSCDLLLVAEGAKLRFPELALGTFVGGGVSYTLERRVGFARARELLLLAEFVSGAEAAAMGLANRALPAERVLETALEWAGRAAALAPIPTRLAKRLLTEAPHRSPREVLRREAAALHRVMRTEDWKEGIRAFHDGREPRFHGR
jgi:enoyl-CoA hydratase